MRPRILLLLTILAVGISGCSGSRTSSSDQPSRSGPLPAAQIGALMPERIEIHPLTRVATDAAGRPIIICHVELRDRFEQNIKALGTMRVELYGRAATGDDRQNDSVQRPTPAPPGADTPTPVQPAQTLRQQLVWDIDLTDPDTNALFYDDLITRTYTLTLGGVPDWVINWSRSINPSPAAPSDGLDGMGAEGGGSSGGGGGGGPTLTAAFTFGDGQGRTRELKTSTKMLR